VSDSSVEADEDTNPEVGDDATNPPAASGATKPKLKTRVVIAKQSTTRVVPRSRWQRLPNLRRTRRERGGQALPRRSRHWSSPPLTKEVEDDEDEATNNLPVVEDRTERRSLSPVPKRQRELEQMTSKDDLRRMREV
jgi:hypothetical protein